jgi:hypothetical protein
LRECISLEKKALAVKKDRENNNLDPERINLLKFKVIKKQPESCSWS